MLHIYIPVPPMSTGLFINEPLFICHITVSHEMLLFLLRHSLLARVIHLVSQSKLQRYGILITFS